MCRQDRYQAMVVNDDIAERSATAFQRTGMRRARPPPRWRAATDATVTAPNTPRQTIAQATEVERIAHLAAVSPIVRIRYDTTTSAMPRSVSEALSVRSRAGA